MKKVSLFEACCNSQSALDSVRANQAAMGTTQPQPVGEQSTLLSMTQPITNVLNRVEEKVPLVATITQPVRSKIMQGTIMGGSTENDRLASNVITGQGEEKQSFQDSIAKHNMPVVAIFPAKSKTGLATLRALTGFPNRNTCAKIQCIVRQAEDIAYVRNELNEHLTDSVAFSFADFNDEQSMVTSFIGLDRLLLIAPNSQDRASLVCAGLRAAKLAGVRHVVLMSAMSALQPSTLFGRDFRQMEECLEQMGPTVSYTHMRMAWFMDNFLDMASDIVNNNRFCSSWGPSAVSAVALADVGRSAAVVLSTPTSDTFHYGRTYHLTGPESLSGFRMAEIFSKVLGRPIAYQDLPRDDMRKMYVENMKVQEWQADGFVEMNEQIKSGAAAAYSTDVAMLTKGNHTTLERYLRNKSWYFNGQRSPLKCVLPASGRIGTSTLRALLEDNSQARIRALVRSSEHANTLASAFPNANRLEIVLGDLEQMDTIRSALVGVDNLLIIPPEKLERFSLIDETIKAAYDAGVNHTILLSVTKSLDNTALGRKFSAWERVLEQNSHSYTIIRSSLFHDLMFHFAEQVRRPDHRVHHWLGTGRFCPVDSRDVGQACASVLREGPFEHNGHAYSLYGPQALSFSDMCATLSRVLGYRIEAVPDITLDQVRATMQGKLPSFNVEEVVQVHEAIAAGNDVDISPDLIKLTGHARTLQRFFEDYRTRFEGTSGETYPQYYQQPATPVTTTTQQQTTTTTVVQQQQQQIPPPAQQPVHEVPVQKEQPMEKTTVTTTVTQEPEQQQPTAIQT